ncbi:hypothetical protein SO802_020834 [Lithocarpus litseifolius]|uniref:Uncharacterized protein n=1 Tax=Lithocarpus litseifolius TaxID=425828 RepID=A0AAW2CEP8_9ROSI
MKWICIHLNWEIRIGRPFIGLENGGNWARSGTTSFLNIFNMAEVDTKPIEPVQVALSLFGDKGEQRKSRPTSKSDKECENEKELEDLSKDLANYKVQLDAKDAAYKQALLKLAHYQKTADELSNLLKISEIERELCIDECREAETRINELESKVKEMGDQLVETAKIREQLSHVLSELKAT